MKYFKTVAEIGKISAAAEALFISAPALSTSISRLEKELGFPLFERKNRRVELTDAGKEFYDSISCLVAEYNASIQRVREMTERE